MYYIVFGLRVYVYFTDDTTTKKDLREMRDEVKAKGKGKEKEKGKNKKKADQNPI